MENNLINCEIEVFTGDGKSPLRLIYSEDLSVRHTLDAITYAENVVNLLDLGKDGVVRVKTVSNYLEAYTTDILKYEINEPKSVWRRVKDE